MIKTNEMLNQLEGIQTIDTIMSLLNVSRNRAIYVVFRLRKKGYVKTKRMHDGRRVYNISKRNRKTGTSYYDLINKYAPIKIVSENKRFIHGRKITIEEALIFALNTKSLRTILVSLALFR